MDDGSNSFQQQPVFVNNKSSRKKWVVACVIVLLVAGAGTLGWLYRNAHISLQDKDKIISQLRERLKTSPAGGEATDDDDEASCTGGSAYTASVGKFSIAVSDPRVIVRAIDANYEGGPVTTLSVGRCLDAGTNVVDNYPVNEVKILAHPSSNAATLRSNFEASWGSPLTAAGTTTIDGVTANIYTGAGLFSTKVLYFDHNSIGYQIELTDTNESSEATLTDILTDWSFTP